MRSTSVVQGKKKQSHIHNITHLAVGRTTSGAAWELPSTTFIPLGTPGDVTNADIASSLSYPGYFTPLISDDFTDD